VKNINSRFSPLRVACGDKIQDSRLIGAQAQRKRIFLISAIILAVFLVVEAVGYYLSNYNSSAITPSVKTKKSLNNLKWKNNILKERLASLSPKGIHIVIDTARNRLYLKRDDAILKEIVVSTGSGSILEDLAGNRKWIFDTPRGLLTVQAKKVNPVWTKPDWAFIEEGEPIPKNQKDRTEEGVLGDYGLELGNGYLIHGTLYTRLLGRNVTHGCVRVGDKDLKMLYNATQVGTKVMIF